MTGKKDDALSHTTCRKSRERRKACVSTGLVLLGILGMALGVYFQEVNLLYNKAIRICLECVGLG